MKTWFELNYSLRLLAKSPWFTLTCLLVVALGLIVVLMSYSTTQAFKFAMPFEGGERIAYVRISDKESGREKYALPNINGYTFNRLNENSSSFSIFGAFQLDRITLSDSSNSARTITTARITPDSLAITGELPILGRSLQSSDAAPGAPPVMLILHELWTMYYNKREDVIGSISLVDGKPVTIIGVMPEGFSFPTTNLVLMPLSISDTAVIDDAIAYTAFGMLKPNVDFNSASLIAQNVIDQIALQHPQTYASILATVTPFRSIPIANADSPLSAMKFMSLIVLLIASLNLSTLLFVRANSRHQEISIRYALGSSRWQLCRHILLESLIICFLGAVIAVTVSSLLLAALDQSITGSSAGFLPNWFTVRSPFLTIIAVAFLMTLFIWLASGSAIIYKIVSSQGSSSQHSSSKGGTSKTPTLILQSIVGVEIVSTFLLLILCGLLYVTVTNLFSKEMGVDSENVYVGKISLASSNYQTVESRRQYLTLLQQELNLLPEVVDSSVTTGLPGKQAISWHPYSLDDREPAEDEPAFNQPINWVMDNYFSMLEIEVLQGRGFDVIDNEDSMPVVVVDELFSQFFWPDESPVGKRIHVDPQLDGGGEILTVVGMISHVEAMDLLSPYSTAFYRPTSQNMPNVLYHITVKLRQELALSAVDKLVRSAGTKVDRRISIDSMQTLEFVQRSSLLGVSFLLTMFSFIAVITFIMAAIGIFGIVAKSVSMRTTEIAIRRALGSANFTIIGIFLKQGLLYVGAGVLIGGSASLLISDLFSVLLPEILQSLPVVAFSVILVLGFLILLASYIPARRVILMEPGDALHSE